jgi:integrase
MDEDKKTRRRLTEHERARFIEAARQSTVTYRAMNGPNRARLYLLAIFTGLRMGALSKLIPESFTWNKEETEPISVSITGRMSKNRKPHTVPIHPKLARELAPWLREREPGLPIFPSGWWKERGAEMVYHDLGVARAKWIDEAKTKKERQDREKTDTLKHLNSAGEWFDFHALRVQFISGLAIAGVPLSAAQQMADHCDPKLTSNIYTKWGGEMLEQVAKLPWTELS